MEWYWQLLIIVGYIILGWATGVVFYVYRGNPVNKDPKKYADDMIPLCAVFGIFWPAVVCAYILLGTFWFPTKWLIKFLEKTKVQNLSIYKSISKNAL